MPGLKPDGVGLTDKAFYGEDAGYFFEFVHEGVEFFGVADVDHHGADKHSVPGVEGDGADVGVEFGDDGGDLVHDAKTVFSDDLDACKKVGLDFAVPVSYTHLTLPTKRIV